MAGLSFEEQQRVLRDILAHSGDIAAAQQQGWIEDFHRVIVQIEREGEWSPVIPIFWLRLHGVVTELVNQLGEQVEAVRGALEDGSPMGLCRDIAVVERTRDACLAIRAALTEDELIYADYRRHVEAHVLQLAYRIRLHKTKGGEPKGLKDDYEVKAVGRRYIVEELSSRLQCILSHYGSESAIAVAFAAKVRKPANELLLAVKNSHCRRISP